MSRTLFGRPLHALRISRRMEVRLLKRYLSVRPSDRLCDIGSGDGYWTQRITGSAHCCGVDIDWPSVIQAQRQFKNDHVSYTRMSAESLGFPDGCFDKIFGVCSVEHIPDAEAAWSEFGRCLKPGGVLALTLDSLTYPTISERRREEHHRKYFTPHLYDVEKVKARLAASGMELTDHRFIISSPLSTAMYLVFDKIQRLQYALFPIAYPLTIASDALFGSDRYGWKLAIRAVKR